MGKEERARGDGENGEAVRWKHRGAAGVKKALAAVSRICKAGNIVQFGDEPAECYIKNKSSGKKVMMEKRRGSYVLKVEFVRHVQNGNGGGVTWEKIGEEVITIDSGAEESVCSLGWAQVFGLDKVKPGQEMTMINARLAPGVLPGDGFLEAGRSTTDFNQFTNFDEEDGVGVDLVRPGLRQDQLLWFEQVQKVDERQVLRVRSERSRGGD